MEGQNTNKEETSTKNIVVYDADFIPFYVCHNKKDEPIKTLDDCIQLSDSLISNINNFIGADHYTGYLTVGKCFRYQINPSYKANRKYGDLPQYLNEVKDHLVNKHNFNHVVNYEADDCVISFKKIYPDCIIISPDKDLLNLEGCNYNPKKNQFVTTSKQDAELYFWSSMLIGDQADGIKGVYGCGPRCAKDTLNVPNILEFRSIVLNKYCNIYGEYKGIKEFTKNYLSLKLIDDVNLGEIKLNKVEKELCE